MKLRTKDSVFVILQFILFALYLLGINFLPFKTSSLINLIAFIISIFGLLIVIISMLQLNKNLSPFPTPKLNSHLIKHGLYRYIRHPIYTGIMLLSFGFGIYTNSTHKLIISFLLIFLFYFKSKYEEERLLNKFSNYKEYVLTTGRFFPKI